MQFGSQLRHNQCMHTRFGFGGCFAAKHVCVLHGQRAGEVVLHHFQSTGSQWSAVSLAEA